MSLEHIVRAALDENAEGLRTPEPDIAALLARGERERRRRTAVVLRAAVVAIALGLGLGVVTWAGVVDRRQQPAAPPDSSGVVADWSGIEWGPDVPLVSVGGVPYAGEQPWPQVEDRIGSFTVVESGVVYVADFYDRSEIIWEGWRHESMVIGRRPWRPLDWDPVGTPFGQYRDVVGNPLHDFVAWVETDGADRGDLVVVEASTGNVLARAAIRAPSDHQVTIASVDSGSVYYTTHADPRPHPSTNDVWEWRWAADEPPRTRRPGTEKVIDVSADVWAVAPPGGGFRFEDADGQVLSKVESLATDRTAFGYGMSPDGALWYVPASH